jgi:hypothetical protein
MSTAYWCTYVNDRLTVAHFFVFVTVSARHAPTNTWLMAGWVDPVLRVHHKMWLQWTGLAVAFNVFLFHPRQHFHAVQHDW